VGRTRKELYTKHSQGQKVKGQGHKVMRMARSDFWPEART